MMYERPSTLARVDCRHFVGDKPCRPGHSCDGCAEYDPPSPRIAILKYGAIGDVIRTTPILPALREAHPRLHVTWITEPSAVPILSRIREIDRLLVHGNDTTLRLLAEQFDLLISLEKTSAACALASLIKTTERRGFGLSRHGTIVPLDARTEYAFQLGIDDDLKFRRNRKTYQEIVAEVAGIPYRRHPYASFIRREDTERAGQLLAALGIRKGDLVVGLNTGAGSVFATKRWPVDRTARLAKLLAKDPGIRVLLLGGPEEADRNREIVSLAGGSVIDAGTNHELMDFAGIVALCDLLVTTDTLALHLAIGAGTPVAALFTSTCPQEVDLYDNGEKIVAPVPCAPCYRSGCPDMLCAEAISPEGVLETVRRVLSRSLLAGEKPR